MSKDFKVILGGKVIGVVKDGVFEKNIVESKHLMVKFGGVPAFDCEAYDRVKDRINSLSVITDKGRVFTILKGKFDKNKKKFNLGFDNQYYCELEDWSVMTPLPPAFEKKEEPAEDKNGLF